MAMLAPLLCFIALSLSTPSQPVTATGPPVFGPGVLSVGEVYRGTFGADGDAFYFFRKTGTGEAYRIFVSTRTASGWTPPRPVDLGG
jgi:hypothetical protein